MKAEGDLLPTNLCDLLPAMTGSVSGRRRPTMQDGVEELDHITNTARLVSKLAMHTAWDTSTPGSSVH